MNKHQQQVIDELNNNILLSAGAGTGKTSVLSHRAAHIIAARKATPAQILCLTFTNKACRELRQRIEQITGSEAARQMTIRTIHGFSYLVITTMAKQEHQLFAEYTIFDEQDQQELIGDLLPQFPKLKYMNIRQIASCIEQLKQERCLAQLYSGSDAADFQLLYERHLKFSKTFAHADALNAFFAAGGIELTAAYETELHHMHGLDFKDLIAGAYNIFLHPKSRAFWQNRYRCIMIDEMQDTSEFEYRMLEKLFPGRNTMMCGDIFQTIYEWRGSNPSYILRDFTEKYHPEIIHFTENYRSTRLLLETAHSVLGSLFPQESRQPYIMHMLAKSSERGRKIQLRRAGNVQEEARWIFAQIQRIAPLVQNLSDIVILARTNAYIQALGQELHRLSSQSRHPLSFIEIDSVKFFRRREIKDVLAVLKFLLNTSDYLSLKRIAENIAPSIGAKTIDIIRSQEYLQNGIRASDFLYNYNTHSDSDPFAGLIKAYTAGDIIVFDIEGTGTDALHDDIVQLSAVRLHRGRIVSEFDRYLRPSRSVGESEKIHHISDEFLQKHGEDPHTVLADFCRFIRDAAITGHNIRGYDLEMLNCNLQRRNLPALNFDGMNYDTLDLARRFYPNLPNHKLEYLSEHFQLSTKSTHNSLDDVKATADLLTKLIENKIIPTSRRRSDLIAKHRRKFAGLRRIFSRLHNSLTPKTDLKDLIADIVQLFSLKEIYRAGTVEGAARIEHLRILYRIAREELTTLKGKNAVAELLRYAALSASDLDALIAKQDAQKIPLLTIHQAKGLEFKYEFLAGLNEGVFPPGRSLIGGSLSDEEKRLFYVALTRAKTELFLSTSSHPSRLLSHIPEQFIDSE